MAIRAEPASEATFFPRLGRVQEVSATFQINLSGGDLKAIRKLGTDTAHVIEQALLEFLLQAGRLTIPEDGQ